MTAKLSQDTFHKYLVKCILKGIINLTSNYRICLCILKLLFITSVVRNCLDPFQEKETLGGGCGGQGDVEGYAENCDLKQ